MKTSIIKRKITPKALIGVAFIVLFAIAASLLALSVSFFLFAFAAILCIVIITSLVPHFLITEMEYNLEGEELTAALIRNKSSRKVLFGCDIAYLISCAPYQNQPIQGEKLDLSCGHSPSYIAVFSEDGKTVSLIFAPDSEFVRELRLLAPSKVTLI